MLAFKPDQEPLNDFTTTNRVPPPRQLVHGHCGESKAYTGHAALSQLMVQATAPADCVSSYISMRT